MISENLYTHNHIRTFTGRYIDPLTPTAENICIEDIAHSLSMQPRFGGHLPTFYSVAEHSLWCCHNTRDKKHKLAALMHDASEAYLMDIAKPVKDRLTNYKEIENNLMKVIAKKFGFQYPLHKSIKEVDKEALEWEWDNLMLMGPDAQSFVPTRWVKEEFLKVFDKLNER